MLILPPTHEGAAARAATWVASMARRDRLLTALARGEHTRLAHRAGIYRSARQYRPTWDHDDVTQEIAVYLLHLTERTNSGWDPARGAWSTWATMAMRGLASKWARSAPQHQPGDPIDFGQQEETNPEGEYTQQLADNSTTGADPEVMLSTKEQARSHALGPISIFFR